MPKPMNSKSRIITSPLVSSSDEELSVPRLPRPRPWSRTSRLNASQSPIRGSQSLMRSSQASLDKIVLSPTDEEEVQPVQSTVQPVRAAQEPEPCSCHLLRQLRAQQEKQQKQLEKLQLEVRNQQVKMRKLKSFLRDWTLDVN